MALLAEQLVNEWLNRQGFFTLQRIKRGVDEIDLLGIRMKSDELEGWHVEVQISFRPVSYIGRLSLEDQKKLGAKHRTSAKKRTEVIIKAAIDEWVKKKFCSPKKAEMRESCWRAINWKYKFVHGKVMEQKELTFIKNLGVELIPFDKVLDDLCKTDAGALFGATGTDIAEIIRYYHAERQKVAAAK
jgi:hypothetical protein